MHIYRGKMNWLTYARDEDFTIVFPGEIKLHESFVASWQWTGGVDGTPYPPPQVIGKINVMERTASGAKIQFLEDPAYKFEAILSADRQMISAQISNEDYGASSQSTLQLSVADPQQEAALCETDKLFGKTSTIINNSDDIFHVSLYETDTPLDRNMVLTVLGILTATVGLATLAMAATTPAGIAVAIALAGVDSILAAEPFITLATTPNAYDTQLAPDRAISRTSGIGSDNDVTITRVRIDGTRLTIEYFTVEGLGDGDTYLLSILPPGSSGWTKMLDLILGSAQRLESCALVVVYGVRIVPEFGFEAFTVNRNLIGYPAGTVFQWFTTPNGYIVGQKTRGVWDAKHAPTFLSASDYGCAYIASAYDRNNQDVSMNRIIQVKTQPTETLWLLLQPYRIVSGSGGTRLGTANTVDDVHEIMIKYPGYLVYSWSNVGSPVNGYKAGSQFKIERQETDGGWVYLRVMQELPFIRMAPV